MATKLTKKDYYKSAIELAHASNRADLVEFFTKELGLVERKNSNVKPTAKQVENENLKATIVDTLGNSNSAMCIADIQSANGWSYNTSKVSALLTQLKKANLIERIEIKGKAYFKLVG